MATGPSSPRTGLPLLKTEQYCRNIFVHQARRRERRGDLEAALRLYRHAAYIFEGPKLRSKIDELATRVAAAAPIVLVDSSSSSSSDEAGEHDAEDTSSKMKGNASVSYSSTSLSSPSSSPPSATSSSTSLSSSSSSSSSSTMMSPPRHNLGSDQGHARAKVSACGRYRLHPDGRIFSLARKRLVKGSMTSTGYLQLGSGKDGKPRELAHRLIAKAFIPNPRGQHARYVNHRNGVRTDNRAANLEWVTASENMLHSHRELRPQRRLDRLQGGGTRKATAAAAGGDGAGGEPATSSSSNRSSSSSSNGHRRRGRLFGSVGEIKGRPQALKLGSGSSSSSSSSILGRRDENRLADSNSSPAGSSSPSSSGSSALYAPACGVLAGESDDTDEEEQDSAAKHVDTSSAAATAAAAAAAAAAVALADAPLFEEVDGAYNDGGGGDRDNGEAEAATHGQPPLQEYRGGEEDEEEEEEEEEDEGVYDADLLGPCPTVPVSPQPQDSAAGGILSGLMGMLRLR